MKKLPKLPPKWEWLCIGVSDIEISDPDIHKNVAIAPYMSALEGCPVMAYCEPWEEDTPDVVAEQAWEIHKRLRG